MNSSDQIKKATLGIGGNIGDVVETMRRALDYLEAQQGLKIEKISRLYKTPPWGVVDQDWFINACVSIDCEVSPQKLLEHCLAAELSLKRQRTIRWGPRTIDIDVLTFQGFSSDEPALTVPHPRMLERAFVLVPLCDIAPDLEISGKRAHDWLAKIDKSEIEMLNIETNWWFTNVA